MLPALLRISARDNVILPLSPPPVGGVPDEDRSLTEHSQCLSLINYVLFRRYVRFLLRPARLLFFFLLLVFRPAYVHYYGNVALCSAKNYGQVTNCGDEALGKQLRLERPALLCIAERRKMRERITRHG